MALVGKGPSSSVDTIMENPVAQQSTCIENHQY